MSLPLSRRRFIGTLTAGAVATGAGARRASATPSGAAGQPAALGGVTNFLINKYPHLSVVQVVKDQSPLRVAT